MECDGCFEYLVVPMLNRLVILRCVLFTFASTALSPPLPIPALLRLFLHQPSHSITLTHIHPSIQHKPALGRRRSTYCMRRPHFIDSKKRKKPLCALARTVFSSSFYRGSVFSSISNCWRYRRRVLHPASGEELRSPSLGSPIYSFELFYVIRSTRPSFLPSFDLSTPTHNSRVATSQRTARRRVESLRTSQRRKEYVHVCSGW